MKLTARSLDTKETKEFILHAQKDDPKEDQIIWHVKVALSHREKKLLQQTAIDKSVDATYMAFDIVVQDVDNFYYDTGNKVELEREKKMVHGFLREYTEDTRTNIPDKAFTEISKYCFSELFDLSDDEIKN